MEETKSARERREKGRSGKIEMGRMGAKDTGWGTNDSKNDGEKGRQKGLKIALHSSVLSSRFHLEMKKKRKKEREREKKKKTNRRKREKKTFEREEERVYVHSRDRE